jgi:hypothetical protein
MILLGARTAQRYSVGLWAGWSRVSALVGAGNFSLHHRVQNVTGAHPTSCPMGTRDSLPGGKAAGAWSWPLTSILAPRSRMRGPIPPLPHTPSRRGAPLKKAKGQLYFYLYTICLLLYVRHRIPKSRPKFMTSDLRSRLTNEMDAISAALETATRKPRTKELSKNVHQ